MAKKKKYSEMTIEELNLELIEVKSSLFNFRFQKKYAAVRTSAKN